MSDGPPKESSPSGDREAEARDLIEVYFELEEPVERDVLFEQITAFDLPLVTDFLRTMLEHDEDEYTRAGAAAELARRGVDEGRLALEADLSEPEELYFFVSALQTFVELKGPAFYDTAAALWRDAERDPDERREAMLAMEGADPARAMADFTAFISDIRDIGALPDDQIELAMLAFVRHQHVAALPVLAELEKRVAAAPLDPEERDELEAFVREGIDLLRAA